MKSIAVLILGGSVVLAAQTPGAVRSPTTLSLMPMPASIAVVAGRVPIATSFSYAITGAVDDRLSAGADRAIRRLEGRTGITLPRAPIADSRAATLVIHADAPGQKIPSLDEDESYEISTSASQLALNAHTVVGALRGMETVLQLVSGDHDGFYWPMATIHDQPRFKWRGLLIDAGRHFEPVPVIERELDAMAAVKLNVLHWHLSEDQGFRVESRKFPKLQQLGSDGLFYTQAQLREVVEYARQRGIRVVPEFDMPGHVMSWVVAYPELASGPGPFQLARKFGVFDAVFDPTRKQTYKFIDTFIGEIAPIFPDPYWHVGGDENNGKEWAANPKIQAFMKAHDIKSAPALQTYFNQQLVPILKKHGKRMMGWDEILQPGLPTEAVIQSWRGQKSLVDAAKQGYDGILSAGYYIDLLNTAASHYTVDPLPANAGLDAAQAQHILGGEATMWGEWVSPDTIDSRIWPRTAAIAERFWSPRDVSDVDDMYRRLAVESVRLEELGLTHLRNADMLLRRLAGGEDITALHVLADVVEPVKGYSRGGQQPWMTTLGPLTHLVDAVSVDSIGARRVSALADGLLDDAPRFATNQSALLTTFAAWRDERSPLESLIDRAPALRETEPLVQTLSTVGGIGLDAVGALAARTPLAAEWRDQKIAALDEAAKPKAALEFPFLFAIRELVIAATEQGQLATMTPQEWRAKVRTLATPPRRR